MKFFLEIDPPTTTAQMKKFACRGGRAMAYEPPNVKQARRTLTEALMLHRPVEPLDGALALKVDWYFPRKKSHKHNEWRTTKPDTDNLEKLLKDCMTQLGYWVDDARVCYEVVSKRWVNDDECGIAIEIKQMEG